MDKIMKALLEAKYPNLNADTLLEIASITPNAELAVEKLCGIYEPCVINIGEIRLASRNKDAPECTVTSVDEWHRVVCYKYMQETHKAFYVPNTVDVAGLTMENYKEFECKYESGKTKHVMLKTGEWEERKSDCGIDEWLCRPIPDYPMMP